ncbi:PREDICTED: tripartite motif-containing protein 3-like [Branchiostoma belcheri]|uniref:RING-type E3 ubiquitin transferase n=1 Tax=Branchiostoma belcheri TaxID=7741 RepID=A0A6P4YTY8_BRABE|nr:PREDICTED: tripartite motif-containing protein 3-like [Branchiostoma belcheri]
MATTSTFRDIHDEFLVCKVCLGEFQQPKMLPCLHTFCQPCLERILEQRPALRLSCPICRQSVPLPQNGVLGLKNNFVVVKLRDLVDQSPSRRTSQNTGTSDDDMVPCTACDSGFLAQCYCVHCKDYLCHVCTDAHRRVKTARSHKVVPIQELRSTAIASELRAIETSKCEDHNEVNKFYCDTCRLVICLHCIVTQHKDHRYVEIQKAADRERAHIEKKLAQVVKTVDLHEKNLQQLMPAKDALSTQLQETLEEIDTRTRIITQAAMDVKDSQTSQLLAVHSSREDHVDSLIEATEMNLALAKSYTQFTSNVLGYGSPAEVCSVAGDLKGWLVQRADQSVPSVAELTNHFAKFRYDLPINIEQEVTKLVDGSRQWPMISPSQPKVRFKQAASPDQKGAQTAKGKETKGQRSHIGDSPQKASKSGGRVQKGDTQVSILSQVRPSHSLRGPHILKAVGKNGTGNGEFDFPTSVAVTIDRDIVVADHDNGRLQVLDKDGGFRKTVELQFSPRSVAALTNGNLLVTGDGHKIHVLDRQGREARVIQVYGAAETDENTLGIAVDGLGRIIVTVGFQVFVLRSSGEILSHFGEKGGGRHQLQSELRVATNGRNNIVVSDFVNHNVKIFDPAGRYLRTCGAFGPGAGQLNRPRCVITDVNDDVIVTDCHNDGVSQFRQDGTFVRNIVTRGSLLRPMGLTITHDGRMVVCDRQYDRGCIKIFSLN